jgi:hypothetical protein
MQLALAGVVLWPCSLGVAQDVLESPPASTNSSTCVSAEVSAKPTRPNVTYSTDTTQCGVVEADYGWTAQWPVAGTRQNFFSSSIRIGITSRMDFRWGDDNFVDLRNVSGTAQGTGDNWFGFRYRFHEQTKDLPSLAFSYNVKLPTASPARNLGTGYVDHAFTFLAGKDLQKYHFDFNWVQTLAGSPSGFQNITLASLACWRPVTKRLSVVGESHGGTEPGQSSYAAVLAGAAYAVTPRLVIDSAYEEPVAGAASGKRLLIGATYAVGDVYAWFRSHVAAQQ